MFALHEHVDADGLMSFRVSFVALGGRAAAYVDRIAKGTDPADLPVDQPTKFEVVINLKTARGLGIKISDNVLSLANEVIE